MQTGKYRDATATEQWRHGSSTWSSSRSAAWNLASSTCKMTYNLVEPEGVASLLKVKGTILQIEYPVRTKSSFSISFIGV